MKRGYSPTRRDPRAENPRARSWCRSRGLDGAHAVGAGERRRRSEARLRHDGGKWFSLMDKVFAPKTLATAWTKVLANKGAAGVDGQSIERFAARTDDYLAELSAALREGTYFPQAVRRVDIPKGANSFGASRTGQDTTVGHSGSQGSHHGAAMFHMDVQQAVRLVIEPIFEHGFAEGSYGFRPDAGAMMRCARSIV